MTFGEKLSKLRKENNYTQEELAYSLDVSRQSVSKWESDLAYPETEKLIKIGEIFHCSMDYLLKEEVLDKEETSADSKKDSEKIRFFDKCKNLFKERKSEKTVFGMPLYHIGRNAKGFFAIGIKARGVFSIGLLSCGVFSVGLLSLGALSFGILSCGTVAFGVFALGILAVASIAFGLIAAGAISIGVVSYGALSVGYFSVGAMAVGKYVAVGDHARAMIAIGKTEAVGSVYQCVGTLASADIPYVKEWLQENVPNWLSWAKWIFVFYL